MLETKNSLVNLKVFLQTFKFILQNFLLGSQSKEEPDVTSAGSHILDPLSHRTSCDKLSEHELGIVKNLFNTAAHVKILVVSLKGSKPCTEVIFFCYFLENLNL